MTIMETEQIMAVLRHRSPMLLVDRVVECDDKRRIVGIKNISSNEPFLDGHFPGQPIMPGVLQLEAMAQTGGILLLRLAGAPGVVPYLVGINKAKFRKIIKPGDQMRIEIEFLKVRKTMAQFRGEIYVDGTLASEAELMCGISTESPEA
ncbi:MAG: 3-hydroxyacyl-ACP dehydratase FabZ [Verrucomicrobia bacterium]|nr:3-hydroxyacyl-ACP dehydratase FabZ [Verrucomicrobiota bacterium]MDA1087588.1 3-hydroxyacyl-ACP dehydratase FabZ [Verrucomicrobiota bacterium]